MAKDLTIKGFLAGPGGRIARQLLPKDALAEVETWDELVTLARVHNDATDGGFWDRAEELDGVYSSGERAVLHAFLTAADFSRLADKLATVEGESRAWATVERASGDHALAVAACIARLDR